MKLTDDAAERALACARECLRGLAESGHRFFSLEDLVGQSMLNLARVIDRFDEAHYDDTRRFEGFVWHVSRLAALHYVQRVRKTRNRTTSPPLIESDVEWPAGASSVGLDSFAGDDAAGRALLEDETRRVAEAALAAMTEASAGAAYLSSLGLTHAEAADVLGVPSPTASARIRLGYQHARRALVAAGYTPATLSYRHP